jgi:hypothetical protein
MSTALSPRRRIRVVTVGLSAAISLYFLAALVAEPMRVFADSLSDDILVRVTVTDGLSFVCESPAGGGSKTLSLGTIEQHGETGAYSDSRAATCRVKTNNISGYTVSWIVASGSGGAFTGHLISQYNHIIQAFGTGSLHNYTKTWELNPSNDQNDSRWGGRVSSLSAGVPAGNMDFGTDAVSERWARVKTGTSLAIRQSAFPSAGGVDGDIIRIGFRVQVGTLKSQPTGIYQTTVTFTAATN